MIYVFSYNITYLGLISACPSGLSHSANIAWTYTRCDMMTGAWKIPSSLLGHENYNKNTDGKPNIARFTTRSCHVHHIILIALITDRFSLPGENECTPNNVYQYGGTCKNTHLCSLSPSISYDDCH